jgi:hypothetical protein
MAMTKSWGVYENLFEDDYTSCYAISSILGSTSPVITGSTTEYKQNGRFILATGPRVKPLIKYINKLNKEKVFN